MFVDEGRRTETVVTGIENVYLLIVIYKERHNGICVAVLNENHDLVGIRSLVGNLDKRMKVIKEHGVLILFLQIILVVKSVRNLL